MSTYLLHFWFSIGVFLNVIWVCSTGCTDNCYDCMLESQCEANPNCLWNKSEEIPKCLPSEINIDQCPYIIIPSLNRAIPLNKCMKLDYITNEYTLYTCYNNNIYKEIYTDNTCHSSPILSIDESNKYDNYNCHGTVGSCNYVKLLSFDTCSATNYSINTNNYTIKYELTDKIYQTSTNTNYLSTCDDNAYSITIDNNIRRRQLLQPIATDSCPLIDAQVIFLVDNSCQLNENECRAQQHGIAEYMTRIKYNGGRVQLAYITFDQNGADIKIALDAMPYNDITNNNVSATAMDYIELIRNMECGINDNGTNTYQALEDAMQHFNIKEIGWNKKIVLFSNCMDNIYGETAICDEFISNNGLMTDNGDIVEVTVVNILNTGNSDIIDYNIDYLLCLTRDERERMITLQNTNLTTFIDNIPNLEAAVCRNDMLSPTISPTMDSYPYCIDNERVFVDECHTAWKSSIDCGFIFDSDGYAVPLNTCNIRYDDKISFEYECKDDRVYKCLYNDTNCNGDCISMEYTGYDLANCNIDRICPLMEYNIFKNCKEKTESGSIVVDVCIWNEKYNKSLIWKCKQHSITKYIYNGTQCDDGIIDIEYITMENEKCEKINNEYISMEIVSCNSPKCRLNENTLDSYKICKIFDNTNVNEVVPFWDTYSNDYCDWFGNDKTLNFKFNIYQCYDNEYGLTLSLDTSTISGTLNTTYYSWPNNLHQLSLDDLALNGKWNWWSLQSDKLEYIDISNNNFSGKFELFPLLYSNILHTVKISNNPLIYGYIDWTLMSYIINRNLYAFLATNIKWFGYADFN